MNGTCGSPSPNSFRATCADLVLCQELLLGRAGGDGVITTAVRFHLQIIQRGSAGFPYLFWKGGSSLLGCQLAGVRGVPMLRW